MTLPPSEDVAQTATTAGRRADRLMAEAVGIIETARDCGAQLRLTGGLAVRRYATDLAFMDREFSDIDFIGLSRESAGLKRALANLGYEENRHVSQATAGAQLQYVKPARLLESRAHMLKRPHPTTVNVAGSVVDHVDIFLDVMRMDHDVDVRGRFGIDPYAISPADILLTKLQIGELAAKDVHDVIALLKNLPLSDADDNASINPAQLARACARDWGIFSDVSANLGTVTGSLADYSLSGMESERVAARVAQLQQAIAGEEKTLRFRLRARVGRRLPWRREVEEREGPPAAA
jgi:hypothetical protein